MLNSEQAYSGLLDFLLDQAGVEPGPVGVPQRKPRVRAEPLVFGDAGGGSSQPPVVGNAAPAVQIEITKLPAGAANFLGRETELQWLEAAWHDAGPTQAVTLVAPGGVGKTALVKRWLEGLKADNQPVQTGFPAAS